MCVSNGGSFTTGSLYRFRSSSFFCFQIYCRIISKVNVQPTLSDFMTVSMLKFHTESGHVSPWSNTGLSILSPSPTCDDEGFTEYSRFIYVSVGACRKHTRVVQHGVHQTHFSFGNIVVLSLCSIPPPFPPPPDNVFFLGRRARHSCTRSASC